MAHNPTTHNHTNQYTGIGVAIGAGAGATIGVLIGGWTIALGICLVLTRAVSARVHDATLSG